jgi:hypothetical protein
MTPPFLAWALVIASLIHIFEEFVFPGGFKAWWCAYHPEIAGSVTNRFLIAINTILVVFGAIVALAVQAPRGNGPAAWLALSALLFSNAIFHIIGAIQTKRYSPGMISGALLYIPLAIYGYCYFVQNRRVTLATAGVSAVLGGLYYFISIANHRRRARHQAG